MRNTRLRLVPPLKTKVTGTISPVGREIDLSPHAARRTSVAQKSFSTYSAETPVALAVAAISASSSSGADRSRCVTPMLGLEHSLVTQLRLGPRRGPPEGVPRRFEQT